MHRGAQFLHRVVNIRPRWRALPWLDMSAEAQHHALQVGLAGPSGSGKSVFSEKVSAFIPGMPSGWRYHESAW